eukprot:CAMPEP_0115835458 /NCGR_PEP_ID=MMETSP0287-20121206/4204_1 /TAXON_ID=412157 /ORGANISM="Chrysochromulina rotalis, Strain UIO044" /LENGTH=192 /DNA_ID=CAMNT_0003288915 /DNA_START=221 /DNA_END=800 /DNA_ORIENTATION=+
MSGDQRPGAGLSEGDCASAVRREMQWSHREMAKTWNTIARQRYAQFSLRDAKRCLQGTWERSWHDSMEQMSRKTPELSLYRAHRHVAMTAIRGVGMRLEEECAGMIQPPVRQSRNRCLWARLAARDEVQRPACVSVHLIEWTLLGILLAGLHKIYYAPGAVSAMIMKKIHVVRAIHIQPTRNTPTTRYAVSV